MLSISLLLSALAGLLGISSAHADTNSAIEVKITKLQRVDSRGNPLTGELIKDGRAELEFTYDATKANPKPGDSFTVELAAPFVVLEPGKTVQLAANGINAGSCTTTEKTVTCTFSEGIVGNTNIKGSGKLTLKVTSWTTETSVAFQINGDQVLVQLPGTNGILEKGPEAAYKYTPYYTKWAGGLISTSDLQGWDLVFNPSKMPANPADAQGNRTYSWKDTLSAGQYFSTDAKQWHLRYRDSAATGATYALLSYNGLPQKNSYGEFTLDVKFNDPDKPTEATITATGPFQDDTNYYVHYFSKFDEGTPSAGVVYQNRAVLVGHEDFPVLSTGNSYIETFTVNIEMEAGFGGFKVTKMIAGDAVADVAEGTKFKVNAAWELPAGKTPADYPGWQAPANPVALEVELGKITTYPGTFPMGTKITLSEDPSTANPSQNVLWGEPTFKVGEATGTTATFTIADQTATSVELTNQANPMGKVSVGDYVWFDTNKDGVQDDGDKPLEGVTLTLAGPDGKSVTDVFGNPVEPVKTDSKGAYKFENLPVLGDGQSYTVRVSDPAGFTPTVAGATGRDKDSSTGSAASEGLTKDGESDLTLDFGFIKPSVSVGDFVWFDSNGNGVQEAGEPGIKDVTLTLTGPDGKSVTDVFGNPVEPVKTDAKGAYTFENLPVLQDGQSYRVSVTSPQGMVVTKAGATSRDKDSSTDFADSEGLTVDGERDATLDFGFTRVIPELPRPGLPRTGD